MPFAVRCIALFAGKAGQLGRVGQVANRVDGDAPPPLVLLAFVARDVNSFWRAASKQPKALVNPVTITPHQPNQLHRGHRPNTVQQVVQHFGLASASYWADMHHHWTLLTATTSGSFSVNSSGSLPSLGGAHPNLRHVACTSAPRDHLKSGLSTDTVGMVSRGVLLSVICFPF